MTEAQGDGKRASIYQRLANQRRYNPIRLVIGRIRRSLFPMLDINARDANASAQPAYPPRLVAWYATVVLAVMYWLSVLDRFIISLLVGPIKTDLGISDTQFGLLNGLAFGVTFCLFGLFAGAIADRFSRRWVIFSGVSVWSISTALCGTAHSFTSLLTARVGVGAGEAALAPAATSMLTDLFPRDRLTTAIAVFALGSTIGSGCAFLFGGLIIEIVSKHGVMTLPLLGEIRSWQAVFFIVGIPGALISLLMFTVPEPVRRGRKAVATSWAFVFAAYRDLVRFIRTQPRYFFSHYVAFGLISAVLTGTGTWLPAFMGRTFGWQFGRIGLVLGLIVGITGIFGPIISGRCVDAMVRRGRRDAQFLWYGSCVAIAAPAGIIALTSKSPAVFIVFISMYQLLTSSISACSNAALNLVTPNALRGTGVSFYAATVGFVGLSVGPLSMGAISDHVFHSEAAIGYGMATVIALGLPLAALTLLTGRRHMRKAVAAAEVEIATG
jgi:MFS family permease